MLILSGTARQTTLADGSTRLVIDLGELPADVVGEIHKVNRQVTFIALSLSEFTDQEKGIIEEAERMQSVENKAESDEEENWYKKQ